MDPLTQIFTSKIFYVTAIGWAVAQGLKVLIYYWRNHKIDFRLFVGTGGMPSSHSAFVSTMATSIGFTSGWDSPVFLLAFGLAAIIMSDAAGVRRAAGQQAKILNAIIDDLYSSKPVPPERLRELLGHTPVQVFVGAFLGIGIAVLFYKL
ncbi:MAG TPA: divergent PAP2 family protein [bacterium]|nr:divergent PAP2 family protein [bacterium]